MSIEQEMTEQEQLAFIKAHPADPWWRLNNLYKIENEKGQLVTFRMRPAQLRLFKAMHYRNIILKARQLGFSAAIDIYLLDQALFDNNLKCGIIAQDKQLRAKFSVPKSRCRSIICRSGCVALSKSPNGAVVPTVAISCFPMVPAFR